MVGLRIGWWFPAVVAGSTLGLSACASRTFDFGFDTEAGDGGSTGSDTGSGPGNPTDPTSDPTSPTSQTDPTVDPTDPTVDPTDPTSDPGAPPQLVAIRFVDNLSLELTFSEPMSPVDSVDPSIFRLSMGFGYTEDYYGEPRTFYQEVAYSNQQPCYDRYCYERCYGDTGYGESGDNCYEYCYDYCPYEFVPVQFYAARNDLADPTKIVLSLNTGITSQVCNAFDGIPPEFTGGLFLHYTDDSPPLPTDTEGLGLFPIGEDWVIFGDGFRDVDGFFPQLNPMLPIPCPF